MADPSSSSYLDTATVLSPTFSPTVYANRLVLQTNNPSDTPLDLSTPLSRVLFDLQEVDAEIDTLTTRNAVPIVTHARERNDGAARILELVEEQVQSLNESYKRLERDVAERYEAAEQVRLASERMVKTLRLGRHLQRVVILGRQLEGFMDDVSSPNSAQKGSGHRAMVPAAKAAVELKRVFTGENALLLGRVHAAQTVRQELGGPSERSLTSRAQGVVREFSLSSLTSSGGATTFVQTEEAKARATSAMQTLYLLSPLKTGTRLEDFEPTLLVQALQLYLHTALTSSLGALARALATLSTLDRALLEVSARCQNIIALESLLETIRPPIHPALPARSASSPSALAPDYYTNFLQPLLRHLDTSSLPSYFWRSIASQLTARVQDVLSRGGVAARTLRANRERVKDAVRECVDRGYRGGKESRGSKEGPRGWEREAAVMVGSVMAPLSR